MSVNIYNDSTGQITCLANGSRIWVGTKEAYEQARQAGTMPTDVLVAITDDEQQAEATQISYDNTDSGLTADNVQDAIDEIKVNFQNGVDTIYDAIVAQGITPSSSTPSDCATAITQVGTTKYNDGRSQGRKDVGANPVISGPFAGSASVTQGKYYIVYACYSSPSSYKECNLSGCDVLASQRVDITNRTGTYFSTKVFFIKATSSNIGASLSGSTASLGVYLFELGNYE